MNELTMIIEKLEESKQLEPYEMSLLEMVEEELNDLRNIKKRAEKILGFCENNPENRSFSPIIKLILFGEE
jgi:hypothetical protein